MHERSCAYKPVGFLVRYDDAVRDDEHVMVQLISLFVACSLPSGFFKILDYDLSMCLHLYKL